MVAVSLILKLEALKFPNARSGSHMESGNSMVDACIAVLRQHQAEQPRCTCTRKYQCFNCTASGSPSEMPDNETELNRLVQRVVYSQIAGGNGSDLIALAVVRELRPYLRCPEPVSLEVRLVDCVKAIDAVAKEDGYRQTIIYDPHHFAKAVLDIAGVKYHED